MRFIEITPRTLELANVRSSEVASVVCHATIEMYRATRPVHPWVGYLAEREGEIVGTCAFKRPPEDGTVEIAYFTLPNHEGLGIASWMATELVAIARRHGARVVMAQTRPEVNASTRILEKLGFASVGSVMHEEDGEVWEWHLRLD